MLDILDRLNALEEPIRIGIIGMGHTGKGLLHQALLTAGIECVALADIDLQRARDCAVYAERSFRVVDTAGTMCDAIRLGHLGVCGDGHLLATCDEIDVLIESSSAVGPGGHFARTAIKHGKHVIMMNAEADLIFGPHLTALARRHGVVYTSCDGDQPGVLSRLIRDIQLWGFELVMAGNIKGFLDRYANPTSIVPEADKRFLDYRMCTAYTDGTKLCVEMALVANAYGLDTVVPGMNGPKADDAIDALALYDFEAIRRHTPGVVDYVLGARPRGGVFVVGYCDNPYQQKMMDYFPSEMGDGPYYVFTRPYHLCHVEAMRSVAEAFIERQPLLEPKHGLRTNVYCYAKRDLKKGERLDGIGGYACYGLIENSRDNLERAGLPICLAEDTVLKHDVPKDAKVYMEDVQIEADRDDVTLFSLAQKQGVCVE